MITIQGRRYGVRELAARLRRMPPRVALAAARELGRDPLRRVRVRRWSTVYTPARLAAHLGFASRDELLAHFRTSAFEAWPVPCRDIASVAAAVQEATPGAGVEAKERAERIMAHEFSFLGCGPAQLGPSIDWLCDFSTGRRWPRAFFRRIDYVNWGEPSDVKVVWELSRCHHLVDLARAHALTGDATYVREIEAQLVDWIGANPVGFTVNWSSTMDVAIRAVNWIWTLWMTAPAMGDDALLAAVASLYQHGLFIADNLELNEKASNHLISDAVGLVAVGALFGQWRQGQTWVERGRRILVDELERQVYPDGVDYEMTASYQRLVTELFVVAFVLLRGMRRDMRKARWDRLERMGEFVAAYTRPDGSAPVWGDADDGRLLRFGPGDVNDHRHLLSTLAVLFGRGDFATVAGGVHEDSVWLLGPHAPDDFAGLRARPVEVGARAFRFGGVAVLRSATAHVFFDAGPVGRGGLGGHGHNDALAFDLWVDGGPLIVDPGAYVYTSDPATRNRLRATAAHNSPMLGAIEMADLGGERDLWRIADQAHAVLGRVEAHGDGGLAAGRHVGYTRVRPDLTVRRTVELDGSRLTVRDDLPNAADGWTVTLTLHPDVAVESVHGPRAVVMRGGCRFDITCVGDVTMESVTPDYSPSYGVLHPTAGIRLHTPGGPLITTVAPAS